MAEKWRSLARLALMKYTCKELCYYSHISQDGAITNESSRKGGVGIQEIEWHRSDLGTLNF